MTLAAITAFLAEHWRDAVEVLLLGAAIFGVWQVVRAARGARVFIGLAVALLAILTVAMLLDLQVITWLLRSLAFFLAIALVVIFQPELRRALVALGSHRLLSLGAQSRESVAVLAEAAFDLANRQLGALIAIERETPLEQYAESGVGLDAELSAELLVTIFHPKTPLHDGGTIVRADRLVSAAAIFPVSQRTDLDRNLGLRHRAGLGLTEEADAVLIVVSEETGIVSICHRGAIERNFDPEGFKRRLNELLILKSNDEETRAASMGRDDRVSRPRRGSLGPHSQESRDDRLAF